MAGYFRLAVSMIEEWLILMDKSDKIVDYHALVKGAGTIRMIEQINFVYS